MTTKMSQYLQYEQVGRSAKRLALSIEAQAASSTAREVQLGRDFPLAPPPPVQFVLCFEEAQDGEPGSPSGGAFFVGFREKGDNVNLYRATAHEVVQGLTKLANLFRQIARTELLLPKTPPPR